MTHFDIFVYLTIYPVKYKQAESGTVRLSLRDNHLGTRNGNHTDCKGVVGKALVHRVLPFFC
jgi:hypothetical protein